MINRLFKIVLKKNPFEFATVWKRYAFHIRVKLIEKLAS